MRASRDAVPTRSPRLSRTLAAAIVVLASAGTGYVGSRIWPLSAFSGPAPHGAVDNGSSTEPQSREGAPHLTSLAPKSDTGAFPDLSSHSQPMETASVPEKAQIEVRGSSTSSPDSSVLYRAPAGQADSDRGSVPKASTGADRYDGTAAARRKAASAKASRIVRSQGTSAAQSSVVEFAPNPRPNQASRDHMGYSSRN